MSFKNVVFASSAPGFVRPDLPGQVVEVETPKYPDVGDSGFDRYFSDMESVVKKLDDESSLLTKEELISLQVSNP